MQTLKLIFAIAFLLAGLFVGGCSLVFGIAFIADGVYFSNNDYGLSIIPTVLFPVGLLIIWMGWQLLKSWRNRPQSDERDPPN